MPIASVTIAGQVTGEPSGSKNLGPFLLTNTASGGAVTELNSASGDNTITVPSGATYVGCIVCPPLTNTAALKLKGASGDTGITLNATLPTLLTLAATQTTFILNVSAPNVPIEITWF